MKLLKPLLFPQEGDTYMVQRNQKQIKLINVNKDQITYIPFTNGVPECREIGQNSNEGQLAVSIDTNTTNALQCVVACLYL